MHTRDAFLAHHPDRAVNWSSDDWTRLLRALHRGRGAVPVIGPDLLLVRDGDEEIPFPRLLARRVWDTLPPADQAAVPRDSTLHALAMAPSFAGRPPRFAARLRQVHDRLLPAIERELFPEIDGLAVPDVATRHPLRLLAEIRGFSLFVCTTADALVERVLTRVRGLRDDDVRGFTLEANEPARNVGADRHIDPSWDLPAGWEPGGRPFLYHLFGRLAGDALFDVTEEDHLEMLCRLQIESYQPEQLCRELGPSRLLLLGYTLDDWTSRVFLRMLRGHRLSAIDESASGALADQAIVPGPSPAHYGPLVAFLENFSDATRLFREGTPAAFVRELHRRWSDDVAARAGASKPAPTAAAPADLPEDGVFISYAREDRAAAESIAAALDAAGVRTYLDSRRERDETQPGLVHGTDFERVLQRNVERAVCFVPLLSRHTEGGGYFRREWAWACKRNEEHFGIADRGYLRPIVVDGSDVAQLRALPPPFTQAHILTLQDGTLSPTFVADLQATIARWGRPKGP